MILRLTLSATPLAPFVAALLACGDPGGVECKCADPSVFIVLPADRAARVSGIVLSGVACSGVTATCVGGDASTCTRYAFRAKQPGTCDVDVQFATAPADFTAQVEFDRVACCPDPYAPALAASTIEVPDPFSGEGGASG